MTTYNNSAKINVDIHFKLWELEMNSIFDIDETDFRDEQDVNKELRGANHNHSYSDMMFSLQETNVPVLEARDIESQYPKLTNSYRDVIAKTNIRVSSKYTLEIQLIILEVDESFVVNTILITSTARIIVDHRKFTSIVDADANYKNTTSELLSMKKSFLKSYCKNYEDSIVDE